MKIAALISHPPANCLCRRQLPVPGSPLLVACGWGQAAAQANVWSWVVVPHLPLRLGLLGGGLPACRWPAPCAGRATGQPGGAPSDASSSAAGM